MKFNVGDKVRHRPNPKVEPWICEVVKQPPVKSITGRELERYAVKILEPHGEEIVNLPEGELERIVDDIRERDMDEVVRSD